MANVLLSFPGAAFAPALSVRHFDITEGLSRPFEAVIVATSPDPDIDFDLVLGKPARCSVDRGPLGARSWTGICSSIEQIETEPDGLSLYAIRIVPVLWLLSQRRGHRVFQHLSTPAIARALLAEWGIEATLRLDEASFPKHEYRAQYGESDLAFLSRLLEDAGVSYFFETHGEEERLVLADAPERGEPSGGIITYSNLPSPGSQIPYLSDARAAREVRPSAVVLEDFDLHKPNYRPSYQALAAESGGALLEQRIYAPGVAIVDTDPPAPGTSDTPVADDRSRARADEREGQARAARLLASLRAGHRTLTFSTNVPTLAPGSVFSIAGAPQVELGPDQRFCVVSTSLEGTVDAEWKISVVAAFASDGVKPARRTPRPRALGVQSAVVVGPPGEEIHVDELGRVRLRFHWDREGDAGLGAEGALARPGAPSSNESVERSPWVRVADGWAGAGWGTIMVPRVGQEVLVDFLEGDPDQPIVIGRAFDASQPHPFSLPAGATKSAWRSRSSPGSGGHHEISFEDRRHHELVHVQSERDLEKVVRRDEVETTAADRTATIGGHLATTIGDEDVAAAGIHRVSAGAGGAAHREIAAKRITLTSGSATIVLDGPDITVTAHTGILIKAGGTVSIQGEPYVHLNPPGAVQSSEKPAPPPSDHLVWFKLVAEGNPVAGARCYLVHEDGTTSASHVTDGNGFVRLPVDKPGDYHVHIGKPRKAQPPPPPAASSDSESAAVKSASTGGAEAPSDLAAKPVGKTPAQPHAKAKPTEHDVPIKLQILEPDPGTTFHLHTTPSMPKIPLHARVLVQGVPAEVGSVRWQFHIRGGYRVRTESGSSYRVQDYKLPAGHARTAPNQHERFELDAAALVGGDLEIKATFHGGPELGHVTATKVVKGCKVLGKNPPRHEVEAYIVEHGGHLAWLYLRMFCHESAHALDQFATGSGGGNHPGYPLYGPPSGVGIVQRDPTTGEWHFPKHRISKPNNFFPRIFWDWKKNLHEGLVSFRDDYIERARRDLDLLRNRHPHLPMYPEGLLLRAAIRRYNGGTEYAASGDGHHYVVSPAFTNNPGYVNSVLDDPHIDAHKHPVPSVVRAKIWPH